jgi:SPP1 family predicted phage head-tail adaptor
MIGQLRKRLELQTITETADGGGGFTETWTKVTIIWGSIKPLDARERLRAMVLETPITHKIMLRYRTDITTKSRLLFGTRIFNVREVINIDERNKYLEILAEENVPT